MITRRDFLRSAALLATSALVPWGLFPRKVAAATASGSAFINGTTLRHAGQDASLAILDPLLIPKYEDPLVVPPVMPPHASGPLLGTRYAIAAAQIQQQVLPTGMPTTTVWGYGDATGPLPGQPGSNYNWPAYTVEVRTNERVFVAWINALIDARGNYLPHLLPVDQTLHWANPPGPRDMMGTDPTPYTGPVPIVTHVHGAHVPAISDGYPEAWYLPKARNIPPGYFRRGTHYGSVASVPEGTALFFYPNDQRASTLWFHDHTLGITRLNVYAGLAGFWLIRDAVEDSLNLPGPAPMLGEPAGTKHYEIGMAIQDRTFYEDGSLFYPETRAFFDEYPGPYFPETPVPPIWNPEFFGNTMVVNGKTWPKLEVEPRKYRFRLLNGCDSRFLVLKLVTDPLAPRPATPALPFAMIGSEGGLLPAPVVTDQLLIAPAERPDVIVDFSQFSPGDEVYLINEGPDDPFGGLPVEEFADPETTGQVMKFVVTPLSAPDTSEIPDSLPVIDPLGPEVRTRDLTLNEEMYMAPDFGELPIAALLGTAEDGPLTWSAPITENPQVGDTEIWRLINLTADAHPIHLHLVMFQVLDRIPMDTDGYRDAQLAWLEGGKVGPQPDPDDYLTGAPIPPSPEEAGLKDTVIALPGQMTRIIAKFDLAGLYVWHCHILSHEDNEMMRPYEVLPA